jgi:radical SAM superfamily enzyme YgiQ (UPF0313 family)
MGTKRVLLLYPECPDTYWGFREALRFQREWWRPFLNKRKKKAAFPPLGLLVIAALLPEQWTKQVYDENVLGPVSDDDLSRWDMVCISAMTIQRASAKRVLEQCHRLGIKTVFGGPLPTTESATFADLADHLVLGEAEVTLPRFLKDLAAGETKSVYRMDPDEFPDLMCSPIPLWELVHPDDYASLVIQFSRGCPHRCDFCNVCTLFGVKVRTKTAEQVIAELEAAHRLGWSGSVFFVDDNLTVTGRRAEKMLEGVIRFQEKHGYPFAFFTQGDVASVKYVELLQEAGFFQIFLGIETPETESLKGAGKHLNVQADIYEVVRKFLRHGIEVQAGFVYGFDQDTAETAGRMADFIRELGIMVAMVGLLEALEGTPLTERLRREGRVSGPSAGDNTRGVSNVVPLGMTVEERFERFGYIVSSIYSAKGYYIRMGRFLRYYHPNPYLRRRPTREGLRAFLRSIVRIGFRPCSARWYWASWIAALRTDPRSLPAVIRLWIFWVDFDRLTRKIHTK